MRTEGDQHGPERTGTLNKCARGAHAAHAQPKSQAKAGIGHHGFGGVSQERQIGSVIADVVVRGDTRRALGQLAAQAIELSGSGQVDLAVAGQNAGEDAEVGGDTLRQARIRARDQIDCAAARLLLMKKLHELAVVRQMRDIKRDMRGDECLERGLAAQKAPRQGEQKRRVRAHKHQKGVDERIGLDERSVEIDTEGPQRGNGGFRTGDDLRQPLTSASSLDEDAAPECAGPFIGWARWAGSWSGTAQVYTDVKHEGASQRVGKLASQRAGRRRPIGRRICSESTRRN